MAKTIFITGASSGLGKATAKLFASKGWNVVATMRNPEKETELKQFDNIAILPLDVTDTIQIKEAVKTSLKWYDVDVVFNNAGYGLSGSLDALSDEQIRREINTNLLGVILVTKEFIPHLKQKRGGRFITTTSLAGIVGFPFDSIYNATKWALEGFSESLYYELFPYGIKVKTVAPGVILTDFGIRSLDKAPLVEEYEQMSKDFIHYMMSDMSKLSSAEQVAEVVYEAATDQKDQIRYIAGIDGQEMYDQRLREGNEGFRESLSKILFENK